MKKFGKFMAIVMSLITNPIIYGFVITKLWMWFIVPTFSTQPLRIVEAIGLMFFVNYLKLTSTKEGSTKETFWGIFGEKIAFSILYSGFALLSGWVVQMFM